MDISISCQNRSFFFICIYLSDPLDSPFLYFDKLSYPCLCLCLGLEQITLIRPFLRISRHFPQILRAEGLIFIFFVP